MVRRIAVVHELAVVAFVFGVFVICLSTLGAYGVALMGAMVISLVAVLVMLHARPLRGSKARR